MAGDDVTGSSRVIYWDAIDRLLTGSFSERAGAQSRGFVVPTEPAREFRFGRLEVGEGWPSELPAIDRLAAVPAVCSAGAARAAAGRAVLTFRADAAESIALCAMGPGGDVHWSIDPVAWIRGLLAEDYVSGWTRPITSRIPLFNYSRIPHALKGALEGLQSPLAGTRSRPVAFPRIPLDDLVDAIRRLCALLADPSQRAVSGSRRGDSGVWPRGLQAAVTLTHDVDTSWILYDRRSALLREIVETEASLGYRSAWYVTADQLSTSKSEQALGILAEAGCELGAHGWNHDSKLVFLSAERQERRVQKIRDRFQGLRLEGIRTPWYCRSERLFRVLARHFRYDTSVPNASGFFSSETNSGCCTFFPYRTASGLVELPMTLPPDTALSGDAGYDALLTGSATIIDRGGVVVITMHPQPHQSARRPALARYFRFLERLSKRSGGLLWHATPGEIVGHYASLAP